MFEKTAKFLFITFFSLACLALCSLLFSDQNQYHSNKLTLVTLCNCLSFTFHVTVVLHLQCVCSAINRISVNLSRINDRRIRLYFSFSCLFLCWHNGHMSNSVQSNWFHNRNVSHVYVIEMMLPSFISREFNFNCVSIGVKYSLRCVHTCSSWRDAATLVST